MWIRSLICEQIGSTRNIGSILKPRKTINLSLQMFNLSHSHLMCTVNLPPGAARIYTLWYAQQA